MTVRYLSRGDVETIGLPMSAVIEAVEEGFRLKGLGQTQLPPKVAIHPAGTSTFLHAMPAAVGSPAQVTGLKWVGGAAANRERLLPTITGLIILNDPETMVPVCIMDCTWVTAMRTAAANAVAMKHLGPPQVHQLAIIGCGVQGRSNLLATASQYPELKICAAWDPDPDALHSFTREMADQVSCAIVPKAGPQEAVCEADVTVTAGPNALPLSPYIPLAWLKPGAMAAPVDYDAAWLPDAMSGTDLLVTDDIPQMDAARAHGYFADTRRPDTELGSIVAGLAPGRQSRQQRTMAVCLGIAIDDCVTARLIYEQALASGTGIDLPL